MPRYNEPTQKQLDFIQWYTSPASPTYDNVTQSAMKAGYSKKYAQSTAYRTLKKVAEKYKQKHVEQTDKAVDRAQFYTDLLHDAEQGIAERVRMDAKHDSKLLSIQQKDQHLVAETIGKDSWSKRTEQINHNIAVLDDNKRSMLTATLNDIMAGATIDNPTYTVLSAPESEDDTPKSA